MKKQDFLHVINNMIDNSGFNRDDILSDLKPDKKEPSVFPEEQFYTITSLSKKLKVNYRTILRWIKHKKIKAQKIGGTWIIKAKENNLS